MPVTEPYIVPDDWSIERNGEVTFSCKDAMGALRDLEITLGVISIHPLEIIRQILEALSYAHGRGVVHRDLKPSNILILSRDGETRFTISDFGLVRLTGEQWFRGRAQESVRRSLSMGDRPTQAAAESSGARSLLGTYEYMSPEQKRGEEATPGSDIYAVGLMAFRLLTGRDPGLKPPSQIDLGLCKAWDAFTVKALEEEPSERMASAGDGIVLLERVAAELSARPQKAAVSAAVPPPVSPRPEPPPAGSSANVRATTPRPQGGKRLLWLAAAAVVAAASILSIRSRQSHNVADAQMLVSRGDAEALSAEAVRKEADRLAAIEQERKREAERLAAEKAAAEERARKAAAVARVVAKGPAEGDVQSVDLGGGVKLDLVWCPAGTFEMGSPESEEGRYKNETRHRVTLTKGFWLGKTEVTQRQWEAVTGSNPSHFKGAGLPVETVSWDDCQEFIRKLNGKLADAQTRVPPGGRFRLPTEAEWEYAARGGAKGRGYTYAGGNDLDAVAWHGGNSGGKTHAVGTKVANELGLFDMSGNVWEWCQDWYGDSYSGLGTTDPTGPASGSVRVDRGGSWFGVASVCRSAVRDGGWPSYTHSSLGFRVVLAPVP